MNYIDKNKLIVELRRQKRELKLSIQSQGDYGQSCQIIAYENILSLIASLQQEQLDVDLEKEIGACWRNWISPSEQKEVEGVLPKTEFAMYASHFYRLRNAALEEAARHVYESWMGGIMDDVRRDMDELGKMLNTRK